MKHNRLIYGGRRRRRICTRPALNTLSRPKQGKGKLFCNKIQAKYCKKSKEITLTGTTTSSYLFISDFVSSSERKAPTSSRESAPVSHTAFLLNAREDVPSGSEHRTTGPVFHYSTLISFYQCRQPDSLSLPVMKPVINWNSC